MFRTASRVLFRAPVSRSVVHSPASRRFLTTPPAQKSRSWKNSAARLGVAAAAIYYYNTHDIFADSPAYAPPPATEENEALPPTIEEIAAQKRARIIDAQKSSPQPLPADAVADAVPSAETASGSEAEHAGIEGLEQEAGQQGAFNPETGEINWACPCLGGMADGPCGEEFKAAFSCFVYSTEEPKGMDCIDKFKGMQDCFRQHPDIYGAELEDDDEYEAEGATPTTDSNIPASEPVSESLPTSKAEGSPKAEPASEKAILDKPEPVVTQPDVPVQAWNAKESPKA